MFGIALCVPVVQRDAQPTEEVLNPVQVGASDQVEATRKRRTLFDIDVYNNNGFGYFG